MSKTAVLISGQARSFEATFRNQYWNLLRHLDDPYFYVSVADDAQAWSAELLKERFKNVFIEKVTQPVLPEPKWELAAHAAFCPTPNSPAVIQKMLRDFWHRQRVYTFCREQSGGNFSTFIRLRPDLHFHRMKMPERVGILDVVTPYWGRYGGCNDRFAFIGKEAAGAYFGAFEAIPALLEAGCPLHPESLLGAALEAGGVDLRHELETEFSVRRLPDARGHVEFVAPDIKVNEFSELAALMARPSFSVTESGRATEWSPSTHG